MIYSVDFDGTLCENNFPNVGKPNTELIEFLIQEQLNGNKLILNTMREDFLLLIAVEWCKDHGLIFNAVNDNLDELKKQYNNNPRKIYADVYIDDHNARYGICTKLPFKEV